MDYNFELEALAARPSEMQKRFEGYAVNLGAQKSLSGTTLEATLLGNRDAQSRALRHMQEFLKVASYDRQQMPQINEEDWESVQRMLPKTSFNGKTSGWSRTSIQLNQLRPLQHTLHLDKVAQMLVNGIGEVPATTRNYDVAWQELTQIPMLICQTPEKGYYILDGHHRWAEYAFLGAAFYGMTQGIQADVIKCRIEDILPVLQRNSTGSQA